MQSPSWWTQVSILLWWAFSFPICILKLKDRYHTQSEAVKQQQKPLLAIKFKISSLVYPFSIVSPFNPVSIALVKQVSLFPDAMLMPTLGLSRAEMQKGISSSKENKRTHLQAKGKLRPHLCLEGLWDRHFGRLSYKSHCNLHACTFVVIGKSVESHNHTQFYSNTKLINSITNSNQRDDIIFCPRNHQIKYS